MTALVNLEQRRPIWIALSEFYLDTELQDADFRQIAFAIIDSPYTFEEVKTINKYEVFPVLQGNLLGVAGEWAGFDESWLVEKILFLIEKKSKISKLTTEITYQMFKWMCKDYWKKLEAIYNDIKINPDTFLITCRTAFINNLLPFQFDNTTLPLYKKLEQKALDYKAKEQLRPFYEHLQEGQYYINFWTAYFLLEKFELTGTEKLIGLNDNESIVEHCYKLIENHFQHFKDTEQIKNCSFWLEAKKRTYNMYLQ
ncbi:DUF7079 family protein [Ferruginibacter sp.]|nr:hypothetical protein [Ferruginibacter sp.]